MTTMRTILAGLVGSMTVGCTTVSNVLIPPYPTTLQKGDSKALELNTNACVLPAGAASAAAGIVVKGLEKLIEAEAAQYKATVSAAGTADDPPKCIKLKRDGELTLVANLSKRSVGMDLAGGLTVKGFRSKVAGLSNPFGNYPSNPSAAERARNALGWLYPWMWVHGIWGLFDDDLYKADTAVRIRMEGLAKGDHHPETLSMGDVTIGVGKLDVRTTPKAQFQKTLAFRELAPHKNNGTVPTNVVVTVVEDNDLGDLIGKSAGLVKDKKSTLTEKIQGFFSF